MKRSKLLALLLALLLVLTACGGKNSGDNAPDNAGETVTDNQTPEVPEEPEEPEEVKEIFTAADMVSIDQSEKNLVFNNLDFSQVPHFTNQLGMRDYFLDCLANRCRHIVFTCEKKAMPQINGSDFCEDYLLAWCNPKMEPGEFGIHYMITVTYYPGDNVAWAYLNGDTSGLSEDELVLYDAAVAWLEENITEDMTDYDKCVKVYEYLSGWVQYSTELLNALNSSYTFDRGITAYGAMIDHLTICQGYADAFDMLTSMMGMNCVQLYGLGSGEPHNWNMIELEGNWYHVDCTWGAAFGGFDGRCSYAYLFASDAQMSRTHSWDRETAPAATDDSLYYYNRNDLFVTNTDELAAKVGEKLSAGEQANVYVKNMTQKELKDYVESLGGVCYLKEYTGHIMMCAWIPA